jgi:hypothetical protein
MLLSSIIKRNMRGIKISAGTGIEWGRAYFQNGIGFRCAYIFEDVRYLGRE